MIIDNFIDYITTDEKEREKLKSLSVNYVDEDWVDEIEQAFPIIKKITYLNLLEDESI